MGKKREREIELAVAAEFARRRQERRARVSEGFEMLMSVCVVAALATIVGLVVNEGAGHAWGVLGGIMALLLIGVIWFFELWGLAKAIGSALGILLIAAIPAILVDITIAGMVDWRWGAVGGGLTFVGVLVGLSRI